MPRTKSQRGKIEVGAVAAAIPAGTVRLLDYQRRWVEDDSALKIVVKARQIGYSFAATLRAVFRCLNRKTTWIFLSKGERQSRLLMEKIHEHIHSCGIVAQTFESTFFEGASLKQLEVRFPNGSVIYGLPANPDTARGYSGNVTLDEFAFHADADKIYSALFPTITRGYSLEVISTPNGQQGKFYELAKAAGLLDPLVNGDLRLAIEKPLLVPSQSPITNRQSPMASWSPHWCDVYDAVRQGLQINVELLRSGCDDEAAWQQEFCCQFVSTAENFFPPELLAACLSAEASADTSPRLLASARGAGGDFGFETSNWKSERADSQSPITNHQSQMLPPIANLQSPTSKPEFFLGIDIGRRHDRTVFWLDEVTAIGRHPEPVRPPLANGPERSEGAQGKLREGSALPSPGAAGRFPAEFNLSNANGFGMTNERVDADPPARLSVARLVRTLDRAPFAEQLALARELLSLSGADGEPLVRRAAIDSTGIGAMLAETLAAEFPPRVEPVNFTAARKEDLAFRTKRRMENRLSLLPDTREIRRAFSSVKKLVTSSGNLRFDAVRTAAGHADEFWAKALADLAAEEAPVSSAADAYLASGAAIIRPQAFAELEAGWPEIL